MTRDETFRSVCVELISLLTPLRESLESADNFSAFRVKLGLNCPNVAIPQCVSNVSVKVNYLSLIHILKALSRWGRWSIES